MTSRGNSAAIVGVGTPQEDAQGISRFNPDGNPVRTALLHVWAESKRQQVGPPMWSTSAFTPCEMPAGSLSLVVGTRSVLYKHFMGLWRYDSYAIAAVLVLVMVRPVL